MKLGYSIINENALSSVLLTAEHASDYIPQEFGNPGIDEAVIKSHRGYDIGVREVITEMSHLLRCPAIMGEYSRLYVDFNRERNNPTVIPVSVDGKDISANMNMSEAGREERLQNVYDVYYNAVFDAMAGKKAFVSIHSFTPRLNDNEPERPWDIGLLWAEDDSLAVRLKKELSAADANLNIAFNKPYDLSVADRGILHIAPIPAGIPCVEIEINQKNIIDKKGRNETAMLLAGALKNVCG